MVKIRSIPIEEFSTGMMERKVEEVARGFCAECQEYTSSWLPYNEAMAMYIDHRYVKHRRPDHDESS